MKTGERREKILFDTVADVRTDEFDIDELREALRRIKNGKTPGTDGIPGEFLKWLNLEEALKEVLILINGIWTLERIPEECEIARVVSILKRKFRAT